MQNKDREFCPKNKECAIKDCSICIFANNSTKSGGDDDLQHEINRNYLKSIGKVCLCCECCDV